MNYYGNSTIGFDADDPEPDVNDLLEVIHDLIEAAGWYGTLYRDVQKVAPSYFTNCEDLDAAQFLYREADVTIARARKVLSEWVGDPSEAEHNPNPDNDLPY